MRCLVQPNSGYGSDNSCMLDTIAHGGGRFKGIAIIDFAADLAALRGLQAQGIVGAAFNPTFHGIDYYKRSAKLIEKLAELDMFLHLQCEHDQLSLFVPWIEAMPVRVLIDHCGRPTPAEGLTQPGFQALLRLARTGRVSVKLSGYSKFSKLPYPFKDTWPFVRAIVDAFTLDHCLWASDWPFLRAPQRQDYGPLVELAGTAVSRCGRPPQTVLRHAAAVIRLRRRVALLRLDAGELDHLRPLVGFRGDQPAELGRRAAAPASRPNRRSGRSSPSRRGQH